MANCESCSKGTSYGPVYSPHRLAQGPSTDKGPKVKAGLKKGTGETLNSLIVPVQNISRPNNVIWMFGQYYSLGGGIRG